MIILSQSPSNAIFFSGTDAARASWCDRHRQLFVPDQEAKARQACSRALDGGYSVRAKTISIAMFVSATLGSFGETALAEGAIPIAGIQPSQRPEGAPVIQSVQKEAGWYQRALTGISRPYPYSLKFLEDQGNWYTPFNHPGMHGRYDIRGWYVR